MFKIPGIKVSFKMRFKNRQAGGKADMKRPLWDQLITLVWMLFLVGMGGEIIGFSCWKLLLLYWPFKKVTNCWHLPQTTAGPWLCLWSLYDSALPPRLFRQRFNSFIGTTDGTTWVKTYCSCKAVLCMEALCWDVMVVCIQCVSPCVRSSDRQRAVM